MAIAQANKRYMVQDYYQLLGVKRTATKEEIQKAYRRQIRLWRSRLNAPELKQRQEAERMLVDLEIAKKVLLNTRKYDSDRSKVKKESIDQRKNQRKKRNNQRKKKFSPAAKIELAFKILAKGLFGAVKYIFVNVIWTIVKKIAIALFFVLLGCLFLSGLGGLILFVVGIYENQLDRAFIWLAYDYLAISIVTFYKYWEDKRKAKRGIWRTSEAELHSFELIGGCAGAFLAQVIFQHKSSKESYQLVYWLIVLFHISLLLFFLPLISPYAIPQKYIVIINALLLIVSLNGIRKKGVMN